MVVGGVEGAGEGEEETGGEASGVQESMGILWRQDCEQGRVRIWRGSGLYWLKRVWALSSRRGRRDRLPSWITAKLEKGGIAASNWPVNRAAELESTRYTFLLNTVIDASPLHPPQSARPIQAFFPFGHRVCVSL